MIILITGTSSGFGKLAVPLLLAQGHTVIAGIRGGEERLGKVFAKELSDHPGRLMAVDLHLDQPATFDRVMELIRSRCGGRLDVLINNAGAGLYGALEDQKPEQLRAQFETNFFGTIFLTQKCLPLLRASRGKIISVSSIAGLYTFPYYGAYCASKFALESMMEGLHYQLKPLGVQVALVEPGAFRTEFVKSTRFEEVALAPSSPYFARNRALARFLAMSDSRLGDPRRVAKLIARLVERRRMPLRNVVGVDARVARFLFSLMPDFLRVTLVDRAFRIVVFRD